uniref:Uncharacterized protein n=2 Tax=environmental samples TaxID=48479 RepID=C7FPK3_9BACT|nr:hypothetical protein [uncultured bacterium HF186_25m_18N5]ACU26506.1 hypothetical protein [uncultured bacterium HF186_25m_27D22]
MGGTEEVDIGDGTSAGVAGAVALEGRVKAEAHTVDDMPFWTRAVTPIVARQRAVEGAVADVVLDPAGRRAPAVAVADLPFWAAISGVVAVLCAVERDITDAIAERVRRTATATRGELAFGAGGAVPAVKVMRGAVKVYRHPSALMAYAISLERELSACSAAVWTPARQTPAVALVIEGELAVKHAVADSISKPARRGAPTLAVWHLAGWAAVAPITAVFNAVHGVIAGSIRDGVRRASTAARGDLALWAGLTVAPIEVERLTVHVDDARAAVIAYAVASRGAEHAVVVAVGEPIEAAGQAVAVIKERRLTVKGGVAGPVAIIGGV